MMSSSALVKATFHLSWLFIVLCILNSSASGQSEGEVVYLNDFENAADPLSEWSNPSTDITPVGGRQLSRPVRE